MLSFRTTTTHWILTTVENTRQCGRNVLIFYRFKLLLRKLTHLRSQHKFRSIIFFKSGFLGQSISRGVIFNFLKLLKKTKYWRTNRGFTFSPEVKVDSLKYMLGSWYMMLCNRDDFRGIIQIWRTGYSVDQPPSIFLGAILLGMNKPRPWKCPRTSSKKRKKWTKTENTAMSEQAKVGGKLKLRLLDQDCKRSSRELRRAWLACFFLSNPTWFSPTKEKKVIRALAFRSREKFGN